MKRLRLQSLHVRLVWSAMPRRMTAKITVAPYRAGTVNHSMMNKTAKITDIVHVFVGRVHQLPINNTDEDIKNYTFG